MHRNTSQAIFHEKVHMKREGIAVDLLHFHRYSSQTGCRFHWHELLEFYYVYQGGLSIISNGKKDWLYEGDIGFVGWCHPHRGYAFLDDTKYYVIKVDLSLLGDCYCETYDMPYSALLIERAKILPAFIHRDQKLVQYFNHLIQELHQKELGYEISVRSIIGLIIAHIIRLGEKTLLGKSGVQLEQDTLHHIHYILQYISAHYPTYITLDTLANNLGLSKAYMCRIFKKYTGQTILTYINELKCSHAASLILNHMPLQDACEEVGFMDYNYFSRLFKKVYGMSPTQYRARGKD